MEEIIEFKNKIRQLKTLIDNIESTKKDESSQEDPDELGELPYKVIHYKQNPLSTCLERKKYEREKLKKENERLRSRLSLIESGNSADVTRRIDDAVNSADQIEILTRKVNQLKQREEKILNQFTKTSREFREVCYLLTGYRIDPLKNEIFRLSHMYAEQEEDKLYFEIKRNGVISLLKNSYTDQFSCYIPTYLEEADSFPGFLAAITLDLFKSSSQTIEDASSMDMSTDMSATMSTTIVPRNEN